MENHNGDLNGFLKAEHLGKENYSPFTRRLLDQGVRVRTLTRSPDAEDPFGGRVEVGPPGLLRSRWAAPLDAGSGRLL